MLKVVDNFLDKEDFMKLQLHMLDPQVFPWYFQNTKDFEVDEDLNQYQFTHIFFQDYKPFSDYFHLLQPLLKKLEVKSLIKVKANLNPYSPKLQKVMSKENRIVIFDAQMRHTGTNTTNQKKRVVLNLNYF